jgi:NADH-quinone oxidoreductase subunit G
MAQVNLEIDGKPVEVPAGATIMEAAHRLGIYVPHFCWHKKLTIAANCRMCLVHVEKAPKPLAACATPVTEGMRVYTRSETAIQAQRGVMEFLLINHPLDCPICDQGGECQLQDLAVGYGGGASRYAEAKRVVTAKDLGPLVAAEEMTRCIQCTRCVRFGREIGGVMELGMVGRGEHAEILAFLGRSVDSELSGNMIDVCPVGALTSKPFRFTARPWELTRLKSVSPHCGLGANIEVQVKLEQVMRVLPLENEAINECWLSDKDRFSYVALNSPDRLTTPMIRRAGRWERADWPIALETVAVGLRRVLQDHGAQQVGALASPHSTFEELFLLGRLLRGLGSGNVDFRLRQSDFSADAEQIGSVAGSAPWLGMSITELSALKRALLVGSQLRKDHPLIAARLRQAVRRGARVSSVHCLDDDWLLPLHGKLIVPPVELPLALAQVLRALLDLKGVPSGAELRALVAAEVPTAEARAIAESLAEGGDSAVLLGNLAQHHPQAALLQWLGLEIARHAGARFGFLGEAANSVGGYLAGAVPFLAPAGLNARAMLAQPRRAYLLLHAEPELDCHDPHQALAAMRAAEFVVAFSPFLHRAAEYAHVLLPIAPFTETAGSFVNTEGRVQSFAGVVRPLGETRPAWKALRVLANLLGLPGFDYGSAEEVRREALAGDDLTQRLSNDAAASPVAIARAPAAGIQRVAEVPIHFADPIARRSEPLQLTADAAPPSAGMPGALMDRLRLKDGDLVRVMQGGGMAVVSARRDDRVPPGCVRLAAAHPVTAELAGMFETVTIERASVEAGATA